MRTGTISPASKRNPVCQSSPNPGKETFPLTSSPPVTYPMAPPMGRPA